VYHLLSLGSESRGAVGGGVVFESATFTGRVMMLKEFTAFAMRGNVLDMAVGIIIGAAFGKIVTSFVNDVLMPPIGLLLGNMDFSKLAVTLRAAVGDAAPVVLRYGSFINTVIDFVIVAFAIFLLIRQINRLTAKKPEPAAAPTTRECPECLSTVPIKARRCAHCTSPLPAA
jgi:large conductance mechanosensitive channel